MASLLPCRQKGYRPVNRDRLEQRCTDWIGVFADLGQSGAPSIKMLAEIAEPDINFRDPFNDIHGLQLLHLLLVHTRKQVSSLQFDAQDCAWSGNTVYIKWRMTGRIRFIGDWLVEGVSEVEFSENAKVLSHIDHWDAASQFYGHLPVIGWLLRRLSSPARIS